MSHRGFSHIGLSTLDLDKTRDFYENVLGFRAVRCDIIKVQEGGRIRHIFFDTGRDQLIAFMEARGVPGIPADYDAGINRGLGVPSVFYHFAFEAGSEAARDPRIVVGGHAGHPARLHERDELIAPRVEEDVADPAALLDRDDVAADRGKPEDVLVEIPRPVQIQRGEADVGEAPIGHGVTSSSTPPSRPRRAP